jgi:hypothetical protein
MLVIVLARDIVLSVPHYKTHAYAVVWEWTLPALLIAQAWAGLDTLRAVARLYPKIGKLAARIFSILPGDHRDCLLSDLRV